MILAADRSVAPPPPNLRDSVTVTDALMLEEANSLDDDLLAFLNAGPPPIYIGFGSMVTRDTEQATGAALEAARLAGCRLILGSGWAGLGADRQIFQRGAGWSSRRLIISSSPAVLRQSITAARELLRPRPGPACLRS